jgi:LacI family transcriptional regulator
MVTIREIAEAAGVSISTVSIVLGGKAAERSISVPTQEKVNEAARRLGYLRNVSARRLRIQSSDTTVIAVFWASDFRAPMMVRFLRGLQTGILNCNRKCELVIHPYHNDSLRDSLTTLGMCNVAIICNASAIDMEFLETYSFPVPIVLYNRHSDKFCTVNVDDILMGQLPAQIFSARNHKNAVLLTSASVFPGMDDRVNSFIQTAEDAGVSVQVITEENSMSGGYQGGLAISDLSPTPDCVFTISDYMAIGALRAFYQRGVRIPDELELISIGNGDRELEEFAYISLSIVHLPMEKMAESCLNLALDLLDHQIEPPHSIELPIVYRERESCGRIP